MPSDLQVDNIKDVNDVLDKVNEVRIISADINTIENGKLEFGVIAQELNEIFPHLCRITQNDDVEPENSEAYMLYDIGLVYPLIKAFQELSTKVTALENA